MRGNLSKVYARMRSKAKRYNAGESFNEEEQRMIISAGTGQAFFVGSTELRTCIKIKAGEYTKSLFEERTAEEYKEGA